MTDLLAPSARPSSSLARTDASKDRAPGGANQGPHAAGASDTQERAGAVQGDRTAGRREDLGVAGDRTHGGGQRLRRE